MPYLERFDSIFYAQYNNYFCLLKKSTNRETSIYIWFNWTKRKIEF